MTQVGGPYDDCGRCDRFDGLVHRPPGLEVGHWLLTVVVPATLHFGSPSQESGSIEILLVGQELIAEENVIVVGDRRQGGRVDGQEDGGIGGGIFDEILGSRATDTGGIVVRLQWHPLGDVEDGSVALEPRVVQGRGVLKAKIGIDPDSIVDLIEFTRGGSGGEDVG